MKKRAVLQARQRLEKALLAVKKMQEEKSFQEFQSDWSDFLGASNTIYTKLEQGAKGSKQSEQWFGRIKGQRKKDQLLAYLHHARNVDEHCLQETASARGIGTKLGAIEPGTTTVFTLKTYSNHFDEWGVQTKDAAGNLLDCDSYHLFFDFIKIKDRGVYYFPPTEHLGVPIQRLSIPEIAHLVISYYEKILDEAEGLSNELF